MSTGIILMILVGAVVGEALAIGMLFTDLMIANKHINALADAAKDMKKEIYATDIKYTLFPEYRCGDNPMANIIHNSFYTTTVGVALKTITEHLGLRWTIIPGRPESIDLIPIEPKPEAKKVKK
jgi:tetrahydromethanopterin S-methyltransferase subunit B